MLTINLDPDGKFVVGIIGLEHQLSTALVTMFAVRGALAYPH
jgi:hypothetical protein